MEIFDGHVKLAELAAGRFDARRNYEWKITLGFWVVMLTTMHKDWSGAVPKMSSCCAIVCWIVLVLGFSVTWIRGVWAANQNDKKRYEHYWKKAEKELGKGLGKGLESNAGKGLELNATDSPSKSSFCESLKSCFKKAEKEPESKAKESPPELTFCESWKFICKWNPLFQIFTTAIIAALVCFNLTQKPRNCQPPDKAETTDTTKGDDALKSDAPAATTGGNEQGHGPKAE